MSDQEKDAVRAFWDDAACGERLFLDAPDATGFQRQAEARYALEPFIAPFADFGATKGKRVLEIGVGLGADHQRFAEAGADLYGIDLTPRAIELTRRRFHALGLNSRLAVSDAEHLEFDDGTFDMVYSWGVIHHSPDTPQAIAEIHRVLKPGGVARVMIYHSRSLVGLMLWLRWALARGRPFLPLRHVYARYLESPGTKAYSVRQAQALFKAFSAVRIRTQLTHADLLASAAGQRHPGRALQLARRVWPRWFFRRFCADRGLFMLIEGTKP